LKSLGFDTEKLHYAIVIANRRARDDPSLKDNALDTILENGLSKATS
jgi:hypothetical protein